MIVASGEGLFLLANLSERIDISIYIETAVSFILVKTFSRSTFGGVPFFILA